MNSSEESQEVFSLLNETMKEVFRGLQNRKDLASGWRWRGRGEEDKFVSINSDENKNRDVRKRCFWRNLSCLWTYILSGACDHSSRNSQPTSGNLPLFFNIRTSRYMINLCLIPTPSYSNINLGILGVSVRYFSSLEAVSQCSYG